VSETPPYAGEGEAPSLDSARDGPASGAWEDPESTEGPPADPPRRGRRLLRTVVVLAAAVAVGAVLRLFVYESAVVVGRSMSPTLEPGEYVLACKRTCLRRAPRRGEVVTFHTPGSGRGVAIKRVVGLPGEWVQMWGTQVFVNGEPLRESYISASRIAAYPPVYVPPGSVYVLGDNRDNSEDSRAWGPVPLSSVRGMAMFVYYPLGRAQRVK